MLVTSQPALAGLGSLRKHGMLLVLRRNDYLLRVHGCLVHDIQAQPVHLLIRQDSLSNGLLPERFATCGDQVARCTVLLALLLEVEELE